MASVSCIHITHWTCTHWCLARINMSGSRPGHSGVATRSHSCLPELFITNWEPLPLHSHPRGPTRQTGLSDFRSDAPRRGQGGRGLMSILQMLLPVPRALDHGVARAQPSDLEIASAEGRSRALPCRTALSRPDLLPALACAHCSPICHPGFLEQPLWTPEALHVLVLGQAPMPERPAKRPLSGPMGPSKAS